MYLFFSKEVSLHVASVLLGFFLNQEMTKEEAAIVKDLSKCDFLEMHRHFVVQSETKKAMSKEEKKTIKEANEKLVEEYGWCTIDGYE